MNHFSLGWSYILDFENYANPFPERQNEIQQWKEKADSFTVETENILSAMENFVEKGFKPLDALHVACAIELRCKYFITVDKGILRKSENIHLIRIVNPITFINELEI